MRQVHKKSRKIVGLLVAVVLLVMATAVTQAVNGGQINDFQDGTTQGWQEGGSPNAPTNIATGGPNGAGDSYLENVSAGGAGAGSKQVMFNATATWTGDYTAANVVGIRMSLKNDGASPLPMRVAVDGTGGRFASTNAFTLPADGLWHTALFSLAAADMTAVGGTSHTNTMGSVSFFRILSSAAPAWNGDSVATTVGFDNIRAVPAVYITEIRIDQDGPDNDEYFELTGTPGTDLSGLTYIVIGDGAGASGVIEAIIDLTGQTIPASGIFVAAEASFTLATADMTTTLSFENGDNVTHLLVNGFSGASGDDLDTDDDCALDTTPWSGVVDGVALVEELNPPSGTECHYGDDLGIPLNGPDGSFVPGHSWQCTLGWNIGQFNLAGGDDTPGATSDGCPATSPGPTAINLNQISGGNMNMLAVTMALLSLLILGLATGQAARSRNSVK